MSPKHPSEQGWQELGAVREQGLRVAREEAHWAMQVLASVGYTHIDRTADDGQSNAGWVDGMQILVGRRIEVEPVCFVSLSPARLAIALHEPGGDVLEEFPCAGRTLDEGYRWLAEAIARRLERDVVPLVRPAYAMPEHELAGNGRFGAASPSALAELARWMHDANLVMRDLRARTSGSTLPRVWPHHFDMGMLLSLEEDQDPQHGRSIGVGLSPGDAAIGEPYWYVNPYPAPDGALPEPPRGRWERDAWTGMVLETPELLAADDQERAAREFVDAAVGICRDALDG